MSMMGRRAYDRKKSRVTDEQIQQWVEEKEQLKRHHVEMELLRAQLDPSTVKAIYPALGSVPAIRPEGVFRGLLVQLNGMVTQTVKNRKARELEFIIKKYEIQFIGLGEVGVNWLLAHSKRLLSLLPDLGLQAKSRTSHNTHEKISVHQQGGVGTIVLGELMAYYKQGANDFRNLGRWTSFLLQSIQGHRTRIVQAYAVRPQRSEQFGSVYQQHLRYLQLNGFGSVHPRDLFDSDLLWQLRIWLALGDRIILMMDCNSHVLTGRLGRELIKLGLREITKDFLGELCPNTHSSGSEQIDGVWATSDLTITAVKWLTYEESSGDHRSCVFDFTTHSAIGTTEKRIVRPECRRLISTNPGAVEAYTDELDKQFDIHRIEARQQALVNATDGIFPVPDEYQKLSDRLDIQVGQIQIHSESRCRMIYRPDSPFSPDYSLWDKRKKMFQQLIRLKYSRHGNKSAAYRKARKIGIVAPKHWSVEECQHAIEVCKYWKKRLSVYAPALRLEHQQQRLLDAEASNDVERARAIRASMVREETKSMWGSLRYNFTASGGRSNAVTRVERVEDGELVEYTEKESLERVVREMTQDRFTMADSSPLCNGSLGEQLGYLADTDTARSILEGTFVPSGNLTDSTVLVLEEISNITAGIMRGQVKLTLTAEEFSRYWRTVKEATSSSWSKIHFSHYRVAGMSDRYARFFAQKLSFIAKTGWAPSRWGFGVTVLLEKIAGLALVNKLRAILLFEADSNMFNSFIFADRAMALAREHKLIPSEQYAERQSDGQDGAWLKRLFGDVSRQSRIPIGIVSADAESCYDRIAHVFTSLVFQAIGVGVTALAVMLSSIQKMKFHLRTGLGESKDYMTAAPGKIIQGMCQGNTAAPACWSMISAVLIAVYKKFGHGARITTAISKKRYSTAGCLYVDDVDLFSMNSSLATPELWQEVAASTERWTDLLTVPGGSGKGDKCFGYLVDYEWDEDGAWHYAPAPDMDLNIVLPDGSRERIALLPAETARVTLGVNMAPNGDDTQHLRAEGKPRDKWRSIATRANNWVDNLRNAHVPPKHAWVSYRLQLWSSLRYGLGTLSATLSQMGEITTNFAHRALSGLGVNRNVWRDWRYLHSTFGGVGLLSLSTEATICRVNLFVQHWAMPSPIGQMLRASMELLQLEIGCAGCPLAEPFQFMGPHITHSWLRSFWEVVDKYKLLIVIDYPFMHMPRTNDRLIMSIAHILGIKGDVLLRVNRCRLFLCSIFLSDLATANGRTLDNDRCDRSRAHKKDSEYSFPRECPSPADWEEWDSMWSKFCQQDGTFPIHLGQWINATHRRWRWFYGAEEDVVAEQDGDRLWAYRPSGESFKYRQTRSTRKYTRVGDWTRSGIDALVPVSVQVEDDGILLGVSGPKLYKEEVTEENSFWEYVKQWGGEWMWENIHNPLGLEAAVEAATHGTAVYVTDGSYSRNIRSDIDGAGWVIYCKARKKIVLEGSFYEWCDRAGSYRGELVGLLSVHLFVMAVEQFYDLPEGPRGLLGCDNLGGLRKSRERRRKIPSGAKHADVLRVLSRIHAKLRGKLDYEHVYGHQDRHKTWRQMSLLEKLNKRCDTLAKEAVHRGIMECSHHVSMRRQLLPMECAAVFYEGRKISGECGNEIRFQIGKVEARQVYVRKLGWRAQVFDNIDWKARDNALSGKPDMFRQWLFKQSSTFCASGKNMGRWFGSEHTSCPNCQTKQEDANHLLHCPDAGRFSLFRTEVKKLEEWLCKSHTDPELSRILPLYILRRGESNLSEIQYLSRDLQPFAFEQDLIGWDNFMIGQISGQLRQYQYVHLLNSPSIMSVDDWMAAFIGKLLHIVHGQWIYRNVSKHHEKLGSIRRAERRELLMEIDRLIHVRPEEVPEESKFLLEVDFARLRKGELTSQNYWVHAIKAAMVAGRRRTFLERRRRCAAPTPKAGPSLLPMVPFAITDNIASTERFRAVKRIHLGSGSVQDKANKRRKPD